MNPKLIIVAGANGSGKTTFAIPYTQEKDYPFLNADEIAKELSEKGEKNAMLKAGRIFFNNLDEWLTEKRSFVLETTLSGRYISKVAESAKKIGYEVQIIYIFLENENICVDRVKNRVKKGGHDVLVEDIKRRYFRSKKNFGDNFTVIADKWIMYYNGEHGYQITAAGIKGESYSVFNTGLFDLFHEEIEIRRVKILNDKEITELNNDVLRVGNEAVRIAKEENRKYGLPEVFVKAGKLYYLLSSGEVTDVRPKILD